MTRLARAVIEGVPLHVTQRGNRRRPVTPRAAARATAGNVAATLRSRLERHRALVIAVCRLPRRSRRRSRVPPSPLFSARLGVAAFGEAGRSPRAQFTRLGGR